MREEQKNTKLAEARALAYNILDFYNETIGIAEKHPSLDILFKDGSYLKFQISETVVRDIPTLKYELIYDDINVNVKVTSYTLTCGSGVREWCETEIGKMLMNRKYVLADIADIVENV